MELKPKEAKIIVDTMNNGKKEIDKSSEPQKAKSHTYTKNVKKDIPSIIKTNKVVNPNLSITKPKFNNQNIVHNKNNKPTISKKFTSRKKIISKNKPIQKKSDSNKKTTYAFIDSQNLNLGVKAQGWSLDFIKFRKYLKKELNVEKAYIFIGHVAGNQNLYIRLQEYGYILVFKPTIDHQEGDSYVTKGNVDTELVLHAMVNFEKYDEAVIITGDGDFFCLVDYLVSKKKLGKLVVPNSKYSPLFKYFTKDILNIQDIKSKVRLVRK